MLKSITTTFLFAISIVSNAQFGFERIDTINVINGTAQTMPWAGGIDFPQFSNIDLNWDGVEDLFIFDRTCDKVLTFLHTGAPNSTQYVYAPEYESLFPKMQNWCLLVDYNCDGKKDIYTHTIGGGRVFKNIGNSGTGHQFELAKANLKAWLWGSEGYMYISSVDLPAILDIDGDSDIDILSFGVSGQTIEYHKNLSMEMYGTCDSIYYETKNLCWGRFRESSSTNTVTLYDTLTYPCNGSITNEEFVVPQLKSAKHAGSTIMALDMNDNGVMDIVLGDIAYPNMTLLMNEGTAPNQNSGMMSQDPAFPSNSIPVNIDIHPGGFHVDVNNDGKRDFIAAPNSKVGSENRESVWYYQNTGTDLAPVFEHVYYDFLQQDMIEVGSGSLPVYFDHNGDGLKDLLVSQHGRYDSVSNSLTSHIYYYQNTGTQASPEFTFVTEDYQNIAQMGLGNNLVFYPAFGDLDGDGDEDMILGEYTGYLYFLENTGGAGNPAIFNTFIIVNDNTANPIFEGTHAYPTLVDIDRDNDLDLILGKRNGKLSFYENTGNSSNHIFTQVTTELGMVDVSEYWTTEGHSVPQFIDIDNEYHLILGSKVGSLHYYDNIDGNLAGSWNLVDSTLEDINIGTYSAPAIYDLTSDNRVEMILGNQRGGLGLYKSAPLTDVGFKEEVLNDIKVYPNPTNGQLTIDLGTMPYEQLSKTTLQLRDLSGRMILEVNPKQYQTTLSLDQFAQGTYLLTVINGSGKFTKKILLQ
ncbi:T9SS type A sorting domain-containing protein [Paracrocinitomix mangrovi]|uniref:T9SS type A sorting domain-containing protein n=1 Tax=Paracrocinitomix mangrovi TaxID=2862509 RepID=UPI001C8E2EFD|nr:T9SS type A sorting domain-containing protein [Paracrocinitomix mangrovi]UKN01854.1 T9SS type A sorting domain-containing protein [Paracrocinitomix mangrovi]